MGTRAEYESLQREYASICGSLNGANKRMEKLDLALDDLNVVDSGYYTIAEDMDDNVKSYNKDGCWWYGKLYNDLLGDYSSEFDDFVDVLYEIRLAVQNERTACSQRISELEIRKEQLQYRKDTFVIEEEETVV